jgi:hypothetical protein
LTAFISSIPEIRTPTHIVRAESLESRGTRAAEITDKATSKIEKARGHFKNGALTAIRP